jgi:DNA-directed RNA polymerase subunit RPC12/RpoP
MRLEIEPNLNPPIKLYKVATCPSCGSEELGVVFHERAYYAIEWYDVGDFDVNDEEDNEVDEFYKYYCRTCGDEFDFPNIKEVLR